MSQKSNSLPQVPLGSQGLQVSKQGLGCMPMTAFYGDFSRSEHEQASLQTIGKALELGVNFFDTAYVYQSFGMDGEENSYNEVLLGKAVKRFGRDKFVIATKFGIVPTPDGQSNKVDSSEDIVRSQLQESLNRLGVDCIDLYYQHRVDPTIPIENTMNLLKSFVAQGRIKYIGLSECTPSELRRAHAIHPITAIQMEWSLHTRISRTNRAEELLPTARELGVGIVAYSPLDRGLLAGNIFDRKNLCDNDWRLRSPRFEKRNMVHNTPKPAFINLAQSKGLTLAQLALAWVHHQGDDVVPIPGTKRADHLEENVAAASVSLSEEDLRILDLMVHEAVGDRYPSMEGTCAFETRLPPSSPSALQRQESKEKLENKEGDEGDKLKRKEEMSTTGAQEDRGFEEMKETGDGDHPKEQQPDQQEQEEEREWLKEELCELDKKVAELMPVRGEMQGQRGNKTRPEQFAHIYHSAKEHLK